MRGAAVASAEDPYTLNLSVVDTCYKDPAGKTLVGFVPAGTGVAIVLGQSNGSCNSQGTYTPANPNNIYQMSIYNGAIYRATNPLIGCTAGPSGFQNGPLLAIADRLITAGAFSNFLLMPIANHVAKMSEWNGAVGRRRVLVALRRLAAKGLSPTMWLLHNGESDHSAGTSSASYTSDCQGLVQYIRDQGDNAKFFVALESRQVISGSPTNSTTIRIGQANAVSAPLNIVQGPDWDTITGAKRYDGTHFAADGSTDAADLSVTNINAQI